MRIREIYVDGFGQFAARDFGPLEQPVTVFYGPNEAGKSTLLEFIRAVLFGFRRAPHDYPPLAGGRHGGRLALVDRDRHLSVVRRYKGERSGKAVLASETGAPQDEAMLAQMLGNNSRDLFEQVFAFTLDELHSSDLLKDANVNNQIYSAGMGVTSLPSVIRSIGAEREKLFLNRGSSQKIYDAHKQLQDLDSKLREIEENAGEYGNLITRQQQVKTELEGLVGCRREIQSRLAHQTTLQSAWDPWNDLASTRQEIASLPAIENFPVDGITRLETLEERVRNAQREFGTAEEQAAEAKRAAEIQVEHEAILQHVAEIKRLQEGRTDFNGLVRDYPERRAELNERERALAETLRDLGPDWDETRLEAFDFSMAVRQEIAEHRDRKRDRLDALSARRSSHDQNELALREAIAGEKKADSQFQSIDRPSRDTEQIRLRRNLIRTTRSRLNDLARQRQDIRNLQTQLDSLKSTERPPSKSDHSRAIAAAALIAGIALVVGGAVLGGTALYIGIAAAVALSALAIYLFISGNTRLASAGEPPHVSPLQQSLQREEANMQSLHSTMMHDAEPLELDTIDESSILEAEELIDEEERRLQEWARLSDELDKAKELKDQRRTRVEESAATVDSARQQRDSAQSDWQNWLVTRGLLDTYTPETADVLQKQIELGRSQLRELLSFRQRIQDIENDIADYVEIVAPLASSYNVTFDRNDQRSVVAAADRLVELHEEVQESVRRLGDAKTELETADRQLERRKGELQAAQSELEQLFRSGGAGNVDEFRQRARQTEERAKLDSNARSALDQLQRLSGPGKPLESLKTDLQNTDRQSITGEIASLEKEQAGVDARHGELLTERGSIQAELANLEGEEESSRLRMQRNILLEQLRGHARNWSRLTLAQNLLNEARAKFERERQPQVIRHAEKVFAAITEGRYRQVYAPLGEQTVAVMDADRQSKQPSELSRGTREQLFLALRFGLIRELGQRTEPLPVIVDEVLVNFDPARALRAAAAFTELSDTNQVLVFTCHPTVVEMFCEASSETGREMPAVLTFS